MTKREALIVSAYTGYFMCDMSELHKFIEETLGRAIYTHELADDKILDELRDKLRDEFVRIGINACDESNADVAPVVHAKWETGYHDELGNYVWPCSNCKRESEELSPYCNNCGAKMDLEE